MSTNKLYYWVTIFFLLNSNRLDANQIMQYYNKLSGTNYKSMHIEPGQILLDLVNIQTSNQNVHYCLELYNRHI